MNKLAFPMLVVAMLSSAVKPAMAQTDTGQMQTAWAQEKFKYAVYGSEFGKKQCSGLAPIHIEAAKIARGAYKQQLVAAGMGEEATKFETAISTSFGYWSCDRILADKAAKENLGKVPFLTEELFLALHYAALDSCGVHDKARWGNVVAYYSPHIAGIKQRPDAAFIDPVAVARGAEIKEVCTVGTVADSAFTLGVTTYGQFLWQAVELANPVD